MKRLFVSAALAALALAPAMASAQPAPPRAAASVPPIAFTTRTLPNGLKLIAARDTTTTNVTVQMWYGVGAKDDPTGRSGFAHLFEHLMFKSTRDMPSEFMDRLTEDVGGENNASTWDDFTNYYEVIPANHLQRLLWAEAERLSSLQVNQANFVSERAVVKEELRQSVLADPYGRFQALAIPDASFTVHPYKRSAIGSIHDLDAATLDDVRAFHTTYYRPDNAALIVVGNFDPAQLDTWVEHYFGPIKKPDGGFPRVTAVEPPRKGPGVYDAYGPNVPLPALAITWLAPARSDPDAPALRLLDAVLSNGDSSRLYEDLVHQQQLASSIFADADLRQQPGLFQAGAIMANGKTLAAGEAGLLKEIARVRDTLVTPAELDRAKTQLTAEALRAREGVDERGFTLGYALELEGDAGRANEDIAALQAVTAADIQRVARKYLADDRRMVIRYQAESARKGAAPTVAEPSPPVDAPSPAEAKADAPAAPAQPAAAREAPPPAGPPVHARTPQPVERTLANGLRVIVAKSTDLPLVTVQLTVRAGGAVDPANEAGLADITANLLTKGAGTRSAAAIAGAIEGLGGKLGAEAGWDGSYVALTVMADKTAPAMRIMGDVVRDPTLSQDELDRLRAQTLDDLQVALQQPGSLAGYVVAKAVFGDSPYGHALSGTPASLKRITRQDVVDLHRTWYRPDNAVLTLAGDITPEQGFALAEQVFGGWARPSTPLPAIPHAEAQAKPRIIVVDLPGTGQAAVAVALPAIKRSDPRYYAGLVANGTLGVGFSSRLNQEIRIKRGLSYGAGSRLDARRDAGPFLASAQTKNESAPEVVDLIVAELNRLRTTRPEAAELDTRKAVLTGGRGRALESTGGVAGVLSALALQDVPLSELSRFDASIDAVTPEAVQAFADQALDPARADIVVVGDAKLFIDKLRAAHPDAVVIPAAQLDLDSASLVKAGG
jgi:zinc protease